MTEEKENIWKKHCEDFPKIKTWSNEKQETAKKAYLAGYEQSREDCKSKWHDLRKDPDDLPKNREEVLLYVKLNDKWECNKVVLIGYRDYGYCLGEYCEDWGYVEPIRSCKYDFVDGEEVIAWCELPKFEED